MTPSSAARYTYLGPEGTFTEAALRTLPEAATRELVPMVSVPAAFDAVRNGEAGGAFAAIENSVEGGVNATLDELATGAPLMIYREVLLPIAFALLVRPGTALSDVKTVTGHPVAQSQVRNWLAAHLPDAQWESAASNADGARLVQEGRYDGAFAGEFAAARYGLEPLVSEIHDADERADPLRAGRPARAAGGADRGGQDLRGRLARRRPAGRAAGTAPGVRGARGQPDAHRVASDRRWARSATASRSTPRVTSPTAGWARR